LQVKLPPALKRLKLSAGWALEKAPELPAGWYTGQELTIVFTVEHDGKHSWRCTVLGMKPIGIEVAWENGTVSKLELNKFPMEWGIKLNLNKCLKF
jgi:hypothetical protein